MLVKGQAKLLALARSMCVPWGTGSKVRSDLRLSVVPLQLCVATWARRHYSLACLCGESCELASVPGRGVMHGAGIWFGSAVGASPSARWIAEAAAMTEG